MRKDVAAGSTEVAVNGGGIMAGAVQSDSYTTCMRRHLLAATALSGTVRILLVAGVAALVPSMALADGGRGGMGGSTTSGNASGGTGGTGFVGAPGTDGRDNGTSGGGGGGGGAGGGPGGSSQPGVSITPIEGGAGGTDSDPDGIRGTSAPGSGLGAGGGGGGAHGNGNAGVGSISNVSSLTGGKGGNGGTGGSKSNFGGGGGGGGAGGFGALITGGSTSENVGGIAGGNGGHGGSGGFITDTSYVFGSGGDGGGGGDGGVGVQFLAAHILTNFGSVSGGDGGSGGEGGVSVSGVGQPGFAGAHGLGGSGVVGADLTVINHGSISGGLSGDGLTQADAITFTGGANTLSFGADGLTGGVANLMGNIAINGAGSLTFEQFGVDATIGNVITGNGSVAVTGDSTITFAQANTYSGTTSVSGGTLQAGANNVFATGSAHTVAAGATLDLAGFNQTIGSLTGAGNVTLGTAQLTVGGSDTSTTFWGVISGNASDDDALVKIGDGVLTLSGANTYSGRTSVRAGTLRAGATNTFSAQSGLAVDSGAIIDLNGYDQIAHRLYGDGNVTLGAGTLTLRNGGATTFSGDISGTGGLIVDGARQLTVAIAPIRGSHISCPAEGWGARFRVPHCRRPAPISSKRAVSWPYLRRSDHWLSGWGG